MASNSRRQAAWALAQALADDPFYRALTPGISHGSIRQQQLLTGYFEASLIEGETAGIVVVADDPSIGAAIWSLPNAEYMLQARAIKHASLRTTLDHAGFSAYQRIVDAMEQYTSDHIPAQAWYLSILGIAPAYQRQGYGQRLLEPTLKHADQARVACYLETFSARSVDFYQRLGFERIHQAYEPITKHFYWILLRPAQKC